jgi:hypothetical protein
MTYCQNQNESKCCKQQECKAQASWVGLNKFSLTDALILLVSFAEQYTQVQGEGEVLITQNFKSALQWFDFSWSTVLSFWHFIWANRSTLRKKKVSSKRNGWQTMKY